MRAHCLWCPNRGWNPPLGVSIAQNQQKWTRGEKVTAPRSRGVVVLKKIINRTAHNSNHIMFRNVEIFKNDLFSGKKKFLRKIKNLMQ
jgi:hypothetical protein